jgi:hypothetical protein
MEGGRDGGRREFILSAGGREGGEDTAVIGFKGCNGRGHMFLTSVCFINW